MLVYLPIFSFSSCVRPPSKLPKQLGTHSQSLQATTGRYSFSWLVGGCPPIRFHRLKLTYLHVFDFLGVFCGRMHVCWLVCNCFPAGGSFVVCLCSRIKQWLYSSIFLLRFGSGRQNISICLLLWSFLILFDCYTDVSLVQYLALCCGPCLTDHQALVHL